MADDDSPNWWERNVEDRTAAKLDEERAKLPEDARLLNDIETGVLKGAYRGGKGLVTGVVDLAILTGKLFRGDQEINAKIWEWTESLAKESAVGLFGSPEEQREQNERAWNAMRRMAAAVRKKINDDWEKAGKQGKRAELLSAWTAQGIFEVGTFLVGAAEVKAAAEAAKLSKIGEAGSIITKCERTAAEVVALEREAAEAAALARGKLVERTGPAKDPWLTRPGEGKLPSTAKVAKPGAPMTLDPAATDGYLYVVKEDGSIVYAPQKYDAKGFETVKHTDLAENGAGRIGGEIHFDAETGQWVMDANSGRYSAIKLPDGRVVGTKSAENLEAAGELARQSGTANTIVVKTTTP